MSSVNCNMQPKDRFTVSKESSVLLSITKNATDVHHPLKANRMANCSLNIRSTLLTRKTKAAHMQGKIRVRCKTLGCRYLLCILTLNPNCRRRDRLHALLWSEDTILIVLDKLYKTQANVELTCSAFDRNPVHKCSRYY